MIEGRRAWAIGQAPRAALEPHIGECLVVDASGAGGEVGVGDLPNLDNANRVLFRTRPSLPPEAQPSSQTAIAADAIRWLAAQGVSLIGIDAPALDPKGSAGTAAQAAALDEQICVLTGLALDGVDEGLYELVALPLDAARGETEMCSAVLWELP